jgi:hypothetical protein
MQSVGILKQVVHIFNTMLQIFYGTVIGSIERFIYCAPLLVGVAGPHQQT